MYPLSNFEERLERLKEELWFVQTVLETIVRGMSRKERERLLGVLGQMRREYAELYQNSAEYERSRDVLDGA